MIQWGLMGEVFYDSSPDMIKNFVDFIMKCPSPIIWYAHYAQYDWRYLMDYFVQNRIPIEIGMRSDTTIYQIILKNQDGRKIIMRDSYAIFNSSLAKLAEYYCPEIPKLEIDIAHFDPNKLEHIEYAKRDVKILLTALPRFFSMIAKHFGVTPGGTFSGTAIKGWQNTLPETKFYNGSTNDAREKYIRNAYYGGIVFLTTTIKQTDCETYDINSSYPYCMTEYGVPTGTVYESRDWGDDRMGIYNVRVKSPDNLIVPILPARDSRGNMRWFRGEFDTCVTNRELVFAANHGYKILKLYDGLIWESIDFPFSDMIEKCKALRKSDKGGPLEYLAKFMQNSIYGKFGARRERLKMLASWCNTEAELIDCEPWDDSGNWYIKRENNDDMLCKPEWGVFITAHARLRLLQAVYSCDIKNVIYGDTDSFTILKGHHHNIDIGAKYGQFKLEKEWKEFRAIAPKVYSGILKNGLYYGAAKGMPKKAMGQPEFTELLENGKTHASISSLESLRVSMRTGTSPAKELLRQSSDINNSVHYEHLTNGMVRPKLSA